MHKSEELAKEKLLAMIEPNQIPENIEISIQGSKHAYIYIFLAALFIGQDNILLKNVPNISDVDFLYEYAKMAGSHLKYDKEKHEMFILNGVTKNNISTSFVVNCRSALLAVTLHYLKFGEVFVLNKIGGCKLGKRAIEQHIKLWKYLGADIIVNEEHIVLKKKKKEEQIDFLLDIDTTMGTVAAIYAMMYKKINKIENASNRIEIRELICFLQTAGCGIMQSERTLTSNSTHFEEKRITYRIPEDIDECAGWSCMCHSLGINADIYADVPDIKVFQFLEEKSGGEIRRLDGKVVVSSHQRNRIKEEICEIKASYYPELGSDQQPILAVWASTIYQKVTIEDMKFPERFVYIDELEKWGWIGEKDFGKAWISYCGKKENSKEIIALDLRTGFAELIAAAYLYEPCSILQFEQLLRGYSDVDHKLKKLGFKVNYESICKHHSVAVIMKDRNQRYILQKRDKEIAKNPGKVTFFGGAVEAGESFEEAAKRELKEELELECEVREISSFVVNETICGTSGYVHLFYVKDAVEASVCNEGNIHKVLEKDLLKQDFSVFARCIAEKLVWI